MNDTEKDFDLVIYHANCYDGFTSAYVARLALGPDIEFYPAHHYTPPPDCTGRRVLVADFAYIPLEWTMQMVEQAERLAILDHHKSNREVLEVLLTDTPENVHVEFDMDRSGAGITWDFFFPGKPRPPLVKHVEDRDLWRFQYLETPAFHAAMTRHPMEFEEWEKLAAMPVEDVVEEGTPILVYNDLIGRKLAGRATKITLEGQLFWCVNAPVEFVGETAEVLKNTKYKDEYLPVITWSYDGNNQWFYCSLRSRDDGMDLVPIAQKFGGGGHAHAAGFTIKASLAETIFTKTE